MPNRVSDEIKERLEALLEVGREDVQNAVFNGATVLANVANREALVPFGPIADVIAAKGKYEENDVVVAMRKGTEPKIKIGKTVFPAEITQQILGELSGCDGFSLSELKVRLSEPDGFGQSVLEAHGEENTSTLLNIALGSVPTFVEETHRLRGCLHTARAKLVVAEHSMLTMEEHGIHAIYGVVSSSSVDDDVHRFAQFIFEGNSASVLLVKSKENGEVIEKAEHEFDSLVAVAVLAELRKQYKFRIHDNTNRRYQGLWEDSDCKVLEVSLVNEEESVVFTELSEFLQHIRDVVRKSVVDSMPETIGALATVRDEINEFLVEFAQSQYNDGMDHFLEAGDAKKVKKNKKKNKKLSKAERQAVANSKLPKEAAEVLVAAKRNTE